MKQFSQLTLQRINANGEYYVYGLTDPRNNKLFYIGKGTGNRVFQHVVESGKNPTSEKLKLQTIRNIEDSGNKVQHILINWGLTEDEAFASEASLINLMTFLSPDTLANIVAGHHTHTCLTAEELERQYGARLLSPEELKHKLFVVKVNKSYKPGMSNEEIYDIVRGIWKANIKRVVHADYVLGVYNNLIIGCFKPDSWHKVSDCTTCQLPTHVRDMDLSTKQNRVIFESCNIHILDENQSFYLYKSIEKLEHIQKSQSTSYIGL